MKNNWKKAQKEFIKKQLLENKPLEVSQAVALEDGVKVKVDHLWYFAEYKDLLTLSPAETVAELKKVTEEEKIDLLLHMGFIWQIDQAKELFLDNLKECVYYSINACLMDASAVNEMEGYIVDNAKIFELHPTCSVAPFPTKEDKYSSLELPESLEGYELQFIASK